MSSTADILKLLGGSKEEQLKLSQERLKEVRSGDGLTEEEENFVRAIIVSGFHEKDVEYFNSPQFDLHCQLLNLEDPDEIKSILLKRM